MSTKGALIFLLGCCIAYGAYWNYRSGQAAAEARLLEERARATKMEIEIERLKAEAGAREDSARLRMIEQQQNAASAQQARELEQNRAIADQVTRRNETEQQRYERQQDMERQRLEAQRRAEDTQARRQAMESENEARQRAARDAQTIQSLENERINARRQQEQETLRQQQQQAQQEAQRRQQQQYEEQRRRSLQGF